MIKGKVLVGHTENIKLVHCELVVSVKQNQPYHIIILSYELRDISKLILPFGKYLVSLMTNRLEIPSFCYLTSGVLRHHILFKSK